MDHEQLNLKELPSFYHGLFKMWGNFSVTRVCKTESLFWLFEERLMCISQVSHYGYVVLVL